ncbi:MAG: hypothetical protein ACQCN6_07195 [Candidatus Bathyarchaeia archaeon]|jgi:hypothetical protein
MVCPTTENTQPTTKQINVTDLTPNQQRELFCDCISQAGFTGFVKKKNGKQTYYTFTYEK